MDMAYFPDHYAHDRKDGESYHPCNVQPAIKRPERQTGTTKKGRTGANESTEIKFYWTLI
jgi:hypothetical protein